jgi:hypothetical protein
MLEKVRGGGGHDGRGGGGGDDENAERRDEHAEILASGACTCFCCGTLSSKVPLISEVDDADDMAVANESTEMEEQDESSLSSSSLLSIGTMIRGTWIVRPMIPNRAFGDDASPNGRG